MPSFRNNGSERGKMMYSDRGVEKVTCAVASLASRWRHAVCLFLLAFTLTALTGCPPPTPVTVPNIVGLSRTAAETALTDAGLVVGTVTEQYSPGTAPNHVLSQHFAAGTTVLSGAAISFVVSTTTQNVPNVVGMNQAAAEIAVRQQDLTVGTLTLQYNAALPAHTVISQNPGAGTNVATGSQVNLVVSNGPKPVAVPKVVGLTQEAAHDTITAASLILGTETQQYSSTVAVGTVISQNPVAGTSVPLGASVNLVTSKGPRYAPNVVGMTQAAAGNTIAGAGLLVGRTTEQYSVSVLAGSVISQNPAAGTAVPLGSWVNLVISGGPQLVPSVVGMTGSAATAAIIDVGYILGTITQQYSLAVPSGSVISQNPAAGTAAALGAAVNLVTSKGPLYVPYVVGMTGAAAGTTITGAGLVLGTTTEQYSLTTPAGTVISQNPVAGAAVAPDSAVNLLISKGPQHVPDVVGLTQTAAVSAITGASLVLGTTTQQYSLTIPEGTVMTQNPAAGTAVPAGAAVSLLVSKGVPPVPYVVGMTQVAASSAITAAGLVVGTTTQQFSLSVPAGTVMGQNPVAGTAVALGSAVNLVVSKGAQHVLDVVGMTQAAATTSITGAGLVLGTVTQQYSITVPSGTVISQNPVAGTAVATGSAVDLVVSKGSPPVPNVVGMTQATATDSLAGAGLVVGTVTQQFNTTVAAGTVLSQTPAGGAFVTLGSAVNLVLSKGPQHVPNVVGIAQAAAATAVTDAGLVVGTVTQQYNLTVPTGNVISQDPVAGAAVALGAAVNLVVSKGPQKVPDVVGMTRTDATAAITGAGLILGSTTQLFSDAFPAGTVISQNPAADTDTLPGTAVNITVSRGSQPTVPDLTGLKISAGVVATYGSAQKAAGSGHTASVTAVAFSPDGGTLATASYDMTAILWNAATGALVYTLSGRNQHTEGLTSVAFSPDGTKVLTGSEDWTAKLWDVQTKTVDRTFIGHTRNVTSVAFSPDGSKVLTGSNDYTAKLWDVNDGTVLRTFTGHARQVVAVAYSPNQNVVFTCSLDGTAKAWDPDTGNVIRSFGNSPNLYSVACSSDGASLLVAGSSAPVSMYDVLTGAPLLHMNTLGPAVFSPDTYLVLGANQLFDSSSGAELFTYTIGSIMNAVAFSPDGKLVVFGGVNGEPTASAWDVLPPAQYELVDAGLVPGTIAYREGTTYPAGTVVHQDPLPGASVLPGTVVNLWVSSGP